MGDQSLGVVWCSSDIIFGSFCDGDLWLDQFKCVPFDPVMETIGGSKPSSSGAKIGTLRGVAP